ncbi:phosphoglycerate dehydrogenase [Candidatus Pacearchaeota archaeon]|nr:phosphoglycerate dehydrogenase [Candidatus Pacearchaeota archaeon]
MYQIRTLNPISFKGLGIFPSRYYKIGAEFPHPDAIILRSYNMYSMLLPESLLAIGRAGIGVNNIPVKKCSEKGIVVFNTPGANANAVKELTLTGLFLASRDIAKGISFVESLKGESEISSLVESNKKHYAGVEIAGKTLGIVGLGEIGIAVANSALDLGMDVIGYDPFISVKSAWRLSRKAQRADSLDELIMKADYISLHFPLTDETRNIINAEKFNRMKKGVRILNFSRGEIVNDDDLMTAIEKGIVTRYVTDFPNSELIRMDKVIAIPHLGASTQEAEDNCAMMVSEQIYDFIENGNIKNSVNFPDCRLEQNSDFRLVIMNRNVPNILGQVSTILARANVNICDMLNKSKEDYAYTIIDVSNSLTEKVIGSIRNIEGVLKVRDISWKKK